ncbi:hypothetical protein L596_029516 [Steinernema carpocapsae]|uniref:Uncharacterized protein n=1 Tax=Steinernema carpocapsae TaxID=34508 RepID=A0A4U5LUW2_STECR|nr:hypothetical protein L596_029516 [Steinernema carpocapsae]
MTPFSTRGTLSIILAHKSYGRCIFITNLIALVSTLVIGVFEVTGSTIYKPLDVTAAALALWYRHIYAILTLFLSLNRLIWILDVDIPYESDFYRYFFFLIWFIFIVVVLMANYVHLPLGYNFQFYHFSYFGNSSATEKDVPDYFFIMGLFCRRRQININPIELRIFIQLIAMFIPKIVMRFSRHFNPESLKENELFQIVLIFLYRIVPPLNELFFVLFNR